jgi:Ser/Thr protein kinase RdoA (MazF antagonist)
MDLTALKIHYVNVLKHEYGIIDIISLSTLPGGYLEEETWLVHLGSDERYVVKTIHYSYPSNHLETILIFQNYLHSNVNYPCPRIVSTLMSKLFVSIENDHYVFVQTFIDGHTPNPTELDEYYLMEMGRLLGQWHLASRHFMEITTTTSNISRKVLTSQWWTEQFNRLSLCQHLKTIDIEYLRSILLECQGKINQRSDTWEHGLIHSDFQTSNTLYNSKDRMIYVIDFGEVSYAPFVVDVATTLFLFLTNGIDDEKRLRAFLTSYQKSVRFDQHEIELLDALVRVKLTTNFIEDCANTKSQEDYDQSEWLQSCRKWVYLLQEEKQHLFRTLLSQE